MKLTTANIFTALAGLYLLSLMGFESPEVTQVNARRTEQREASRESRRNQRQALRDSKIALERYRRGCQPVVDKDSDSELFHGPETVFVDSVSGNPFPAGIEICNGRGWTAITKADGTARSVAIASAVDSNKNEVDDFSEAVAIFKRNQDL